MLKYFRPNPKLVAPAHQRADFVELFFDLVFVYAFTRITGLTAHHLDGQHLLQGFLIFWLVWWAWTLFTSALNAADTRLAEVRLGVLIATAIAFVMASYIPQAFDDGVLWFVIPYILIRFLGIGLYLRVTSSLHLKRTSTIAFTVVSSIGFIALIIGCFQDPSVRLWWWLAAIGFDMISAFVGAQLEGWKLHPVHFSERHGLIMIIALGESLIVAAHGVSGQAPQMDLIIVGGLCVLVTCLLWWSYFAWITEHLEKFFALREGGEQVKAGRDIYSLLHFPIVCGIIGLAIGFELIMGHPGDPLTLPVALALGGGYVLFVLFTALAVLRASKQILLPRLLFLVITIPGLYFSIGHPVYIALGVISISLLGIVIVEWTKCRRLSY